MKIMDVTFRESVLCNKSFAIEKIFTTIKKLSCTNVDYIEIGYLKNSAGNNPLFGYSPDYIEKCYNICRNETGLVAMMHPEDFSPIFYSEDVMKKISMIRITSKPENIHKTKDIVAYFNNLGVQTSINLLRGSKFTDEESLKYCNIAKDFGADYYYIADSNGNLLPEQVRSRISTLKQCSGIKIGFHAHDNLGLALMNAIEAVNAGVDILDSSLLGYGKGTGNLKTELFPVVLGRIGKEKSIDGFYNLFKAAQYFYRHVSKPNPIEEQYKFSMYGLFNIDLDFDRLIGKISEHTGAKDYELALKYILDSGGDAEKIRERIKNEASILLDN